MHISRYKNLASLHFGDMYENYNAYTKTRKL